MNFKDFIHELEQIDESCGVSAWHVTYDGYEIRVSIELATNYFKFLEEDNG